ncbi:MAG: LysR family transcriptional regulator [Pseudomonadota bacterium]
MEKDWAHVQSFVAVADHGSLSAAARVRRASQPTMSRHIALLEDAVGARLFERDKSGMILTETGAALLEQASKMADAAAQMDLIPQQADGALSGVVRITASQIVATYILPNVLVALRQKYPAIAVELVASDDTNNLLRREADIAVRMYRPTQDDMISALCGQLELGAFAAESYIARRGMPMPGAEGLLRHDVIGYDRSTQIIDAMRALGVTVNRDFFCFRCDDQVVCWQMVRAGLGIGFNQLHIGDSDPKVRRVSGAAPVGRLPVWLTAHPEVKKVPRIRRVFDFLRPALARTCARTA